MSLCAMVFASGSPQPCASLLLLLVTESMCPLIDVHVGLDDWGGPFARGQRPMHITRERQRKVKVERTHRRNGLELDSSL